MKSWQILSVNYQTLCKTKLGKKESMESVREVSTYGDAASYTDTYKLQC